jgi:uncharacterized caspase-like protein
MRARTCEFRTGRLGRGHGGTGYSDRGSSGMGWLGLVIVTVVVCLGLPVEAGAATRFAESPCFKQEGAAAAQVCEKLAHEVSHDIGAVRALGDELERGGRYDAAATTYRVALTVHPDHRDLLQRLIRARGQSRSLRLLSANTERPPTSTALAASTTAANTTSAAVPPGTASTTARPTGTTVSAAPRAAPPAATPPVRESISSAAARPAQSAATPASDATRDTVASPPARYLALIIGNEQYTNFTPLRTPIADARAIATVLERDYAFTTTVLTNATRYQIVSALSRLRREATENDNVVIYYAGHGYLDDATARGYWLPVDAERDNIANWLSTSDITDVLAGIQARHALILADSCFSGALLRSDPTIVLDERQSLLKKLATRRSRSIMTSGGLEPVSDNGDGRHSVFAAALLRALRENRQLLEAGRLFMQIRERVALGAAQTPQYGPLRNAGHDGGDFIFARHSSTAR